MQASTAAFGTVVSGVDQVIEHAVGIQLPIFRRNICTSPSFEDGLGDWRVYNGIGGTSATLPVPTRSSTQAWIGTHSQHVALPASTFGQYVAFNFVQRPGAFYAMSGWVWLESTCPSISIVNANSANVVSTRGSWQRIVGYITGSNQVRPFGMLIGFGSNAPGGAGSGFFLDGVVIEEVPVAPVSWGSYFDGDNGGTWDGIPGFSTSTLPVNPYPDATLAVDKIHVERSLSTNLPSESTLIDGYMTATARITLSGLMDPTDETKTAAWLFTPDETTSPLYGLDPLDSLVTVDQGVYTGTAAELIRTFTGYVDDVVVDTIAGTVELSCLDPMTKFRPSVSIPSIAYRSIDSGNNPGLTGTWVMEAVLRQNGYYSSPPPRQSCLLYASMHGSAYPEVVGNVANTVAMKANSNLDFFSVGGVVGGTPAQYDALMGTGVWGGIPVVRNPQILYAPIPAQYTNAVTINSTGAMFFECDAFADATQTATSKWIAQVGATSGVTIEWNWTAGDTAVAPHFVLNRAVGGTTPLALGAASLPTGGWHHVSIQVVFTGTTTATVTVTIDGTITTVNLTGLPVDSPGDVTAVDRTGVIWNGYLDTFQITGEAYGLPYGTGRAFVPTAYVDRSLNPLAVTADTSGLDAKTVIQQLAEAERGIAGFDELGVFRFTNRKNIVAATSSRTVTSAASLKALQAQTSKSTVATHVQVPATGYTLAKGAAYSATDTIVIPKNSTIVIQATTAGVALSPLGVDPGLPTPTGGWPTSAGLVIGWRAAKDAAGSVDVGYGIRFTAESVSPTQIKITGVNSNPFDVYLVSSVAYPATSVGLPNLTVFATLATVGTGSNGDSQWPPVEDGGAAANLDDGEVLLAIQANPWMQDAASAQSLADDLLGDMYRPRALLTNTAIVPDPRLQLGDRVTIADPDGSKMNDDAYVFGLIIDDSASEWNQTINFRRISNPGDWVMGVVGRSEMGSTTRI